MAVLKASINISVDANRAGDTIDSNDIAKAYTSTILKSWMLSANSIILIDSLCKLEVSCFYLFVITWARKFRAINLFE